MRCDACRLLQVCSRQLETAALEQSAARDEKIGPPLAVPFGKRRHACRSFGPPLTQIAGDSRQHDLDARRPGATDQSLQAPAKLGNNRFLLLRRINVRLVSYDPRLESA